MTLSDNIQVEHYDSVNKTIDVPDVKAFIKKICKEDYSAVELNDLPQDLLHQICERKIKVRQLVRVEKIEQEAGDKLIKTSTNEGK